MSKKNKILILILILIFTILTIMSTYSKYMNIAEGNASKKIAQWVIKINDTDVSTSLVVDENSNATNSTNTPTGNGKIEFIIDDFEWDETEYVKPPKVAPGMKGTFSLKIDPTGTEVALKYTIKIDKTALADLEDVNLKITGYTINGDSQTLQEDENGNMIIQKVKTLDEIKSADSCIDNLKIEVTWENADTEESNRADSEIGSLPNTVIKLPIEVNFIQYTGEI